MELLDKLAAPIEQQLRELRGSSASRTIDISMIGWDVYFQMASYEGDDVLIEVPGQTTFRSGLARFDQEWLGELGFNPPDSENPNWWIGIAGGGDPEIDRGARAVVRALVEVYGVTAPTLAKALGLENVTFEWADVDQDHVIREVAQNILEPGQYSCDKYKLWASTASSGLPDGTQLVLGTEYGLTRVQFLGPAYLEDSSDDSDWSTYFAMKAAGASFSMFPDVPAIIHRIRRAIELHTEHVASGQNPFKRHL